MASTSDSNLDTKWGPFRVRLWNNLHLPAGKGDWWAMVHEGDTELLKASGRQRGVVVAAVGAAMGVLATERGLRLKAWRAK